MIYKYREPKTCLWSNIYTFDIETEGLDARKDSFIYGVVYDGRRFHRFDDPDKMRDKMQELANAGKVGVAHNFEYDLTSLFGNLIRAAAHYIHRSRFLYITIQYDKGKRHRRLKFLDSMNIFPCSVKDIGDIVDLPKLESDYNYKPGQEITEDDWRYCERDCEIVYKGVKDLRRLIKTFGIDLRMTLASTVFQLNNKCLYEAGMTLSLIHI